MGTQKPNQQKYVQTISELKILLIVLFFATTQMACNLIPRENITFSRSEHSEKLQDPINGDSGGDPLLPPVRYETSLIADANFDSAGISSQKRLWLARLYESIESSRSTLLQYATNRNTYDLGRGLGNALNAISRGIRGTGDPGLVEEIYIFTQVARENLADNWICRGSENQLGVDGYTNWVWLGLHHVVDCAEGLATWPDLYGKDTHQADEVIAHGAFAFAAYVLHLNRGIDPKFGEAADFWTNYLHNHFLQKWYNRSGQNDPVVAWEAKESEVGNALYRRFPVVRFYQLRLAYSLWKLTGNSFYEARIVPIEDQLINHFQVNPEYPTAYLWKHTFPGEGSDQGWQRTNYANYTLLNFMEMYLEGVGRFSDSSHLSKFATTLEHFVYDPDRFAPDWSEMSYRVDGSTETYGFNLYNFSAFINWDTTGRLQQLSEMKYSSGRAGIAVAGNMLLTLEVQNK